MRKLFFVLVFSALLSGAVFGEIPEKIKDVIIEGNYRIEADTTIMPVIKTRPGEILNAKKLRKDLKNIYELGYFSDVKVYSINDMDVKDTDVQSTDGTVIKFKVVEKPIISYMRVYGIDKLGLDKIKEAVLFPSELQAIEVRDGKEKDKRWGDKVGTFKLEKKFFYDKTLANFYRQKIKELYKKEGYYFADASVKSVADTVIAETTPKAVVVDLKITEGERVRVKKVDFEGYKEFNWFYLWWIMQMNKGDIYDEAVLKNDIEKIKEAYRKDGFMDVAVDEPYITFNEKKDEMYIKLVIYEGKQYKTGKIEITGNDLFSETEILNVMKNKPGDRFNKTEFDLDLSRIYALYSEKGYLYTGVVPKTDMDKSTGLVNIRIEIFEGGMAYIEDIEVKGNTTTREYIILCELTLKKGDIFNGKKIADSQQKLMQTGFFEMVNMTTRPGTRDDMKVLVIDVKEQRTGVAQVGLSYSEQDALVGYLQISQNNLFGTGQSVSGKVEYGQRKLNFELSYNYPYLFDSYWVGFDIYNTTRNWLSTDGYRDNRVGGDVKFGKTIYDFNKAFLTYRFEQVNILEIDSAKAPEALQLGSSRTSSLALAVLRDTRDEIYHPNRGYKVTLTNEYAGYPIPFSDVKFYRPTVELACYIPTFWKLVLAMRLTSSVIMNVVDNPRDVPEYEKFILGGANTIRGYNERTIRPGKTQEGGYSMLMLNVEYRFPIVERVLYGAAFADIGNVWSNIYEAYRPKYWLPAVPINKAMDVEEESYKRMKVGLGLGIRFDTPIGPIRFDVGYSPYTGEVVPHFSIMEAF